MERPVEIAGRLAATDPLRGLIAAAPRRASGIAALARKLCEIPAPTFKEGPRAEAIVSELKWRGMAPVEKDGIGNVTVTVDSGRPGASLLVTAHMDTIFPEGTVCRVEERDGWMYAPGIADNTAGVAIALFAAEEMLKNRLPPRGRVTFAFTVGEEGLGDLRGMRRLFEQGRGGFDAVLVLDGDIGQVLSQPVGSVRYSLMVTGPGGHSWADFGKPSALHVLIQLAEPLTRMKVPTGPRTTFNIGVLSGGTSVNSIAAEATMLVDLRSVDARALGDVEERLLAIMRGAELPGEISLRIQKVGDRPVGDAALTREPSALVSAALDRLGIEAIPSASSSDANIPLSVGVPATVVGIRRSVGVHSTGEGVEIASLGIGLAVSLLSAAALLEAYGAADAPAKGASK
ncbi:MAG: M20/M25/M40 family metallo-hydrolase [Planctomycetota bacterium]|nr:M20/M25/M40 family metallo-hydrolase [Planctomycetota bacterium]